MTSVLDLVIVPKLADLVVECLPFEGAGDLEYLADLAQSYKYTALNRAETLETIKGIDGMFWKIRDRESGRVGGVVYVAYHQAIDVWTLDGYRDHIVTKRLTPTADYSYRAARLVLDYALDNLTERIATYHHVGNRAATILCKRLGFKVVHERIDTPFGPFVALKKEREEHGS